jgi:hypothetical protein
LLSSLRIRNPALIYPCNIQGPGLVLLYSFCIDLSALSGHLLSDGGELIFGAFDELDESAVVVLKLLGRLEAGGQLSVIVSTRILLGVAGQIDDTVETNAHLLAALEDLKDKPFVPVTIDNGYMGYSWTKLPKVIKAEVSMGKELLRHLINCGELVCFDALSITVRTSDGKAFSSDVDMAVITEKPNDRHHWVDETVCVTRGARDCLSVENIWFHLGGYNDEGDSYDTQLYDFEKELDEFWNELIGSYETVRQQLIKELYPLYNKWRRVTILEDCGLEILFKDGSIERVKPPAESV